MQGEGEREGKKPNPNSNCFIRETPLLWGRALNAHYKVRTHCSAPVYITGAGRRWALTAPSQFSSRRRLHSLPLPQVMAQPGSGCKATTRCLEGTAPPAMAQSDAEALTGALDKDEGRASPCTPSTPSVCSPPSAASSVPSAGKNICSSCGLEILDRYLLKVSQGRCCLHVHGCGLQPGE